MTPYYQDEWATIYHGDCREILPELDRVDLVLTDPPYNLGIEYGQHNDQMDDDQWTKWLNGWFPWALEHASRTLVNTGHPKLLAYGTCKPWNALICWHKPAAMGRGPLGFNNWEPVALWGKGEKSGTDVVRAPIVPDGAVDGHPCPKPLLWAKGLLALFPSAQLILDPFVGSGTTLRAAKDLNRHSIGIEIEEKYCEIAANRLAQEVFDFG